MSSNKKILLRGDGNKSIGLGHLYRLISIYEMIKSDYNCELLVNSNSIIPFPEELISIRRLPRNITTENEPAWINEHYPSTEYSIIADGYQFDSKYQKKINALNFKFVYIDDFHTEHMYADIVINHSLGVFKKMYTAEKYTKFALGSSYAMIRSVFLEAASKKREINNIENIFICFGGGDPNDFTFKIAKLVSSLKLFQKIHVVLGAAYNHTDIVNLSTQNKAIKIHRELNEKGLLAVMQTCQIAIAPGSTILYELCAVQMHIIAGYYTDNQLPIYNGLLEKGAITGLGDFNEITSEKLNFALKKIIADNNSSTQLIEQTVLFNERNKGAFLELINSLH